MLKAEQAFARFAADQGLLEGVKSGALSLRRGRRHGFDVAAHLPRLILQPPHRGIEGVADGDIDVLMGVVGGLGPIDHHVFPRHADIDPHAIELALVMMAVRAPRPRRCSR